MRIVIHEWSCSGGMAAPHPLATEGRAMFSALLDDAARDAEFEVVALVGEGVDLPLPAGVRVCHVPPGRELETLGRAAAAADATLVVAPETEGILRRRIAVVRNAGGRVIAPSDAFVALAGDKQATADALAAAGVPVPAGRRLDAGADWPAGFRRPAVRKPLDGVGGEGRLIVGLHDPCPTPAARATRLEAFVAGTGVGVSCLCGAGSTVALAALRQVHADPPSGGYLGGEPLSDPRSSARAECLARRAVAALARAAGDPHAAQGWVGVDLILGDRPDGRDDRVLEINPRVTTSFVGQSAGLSGSLVRAMLVVAAGGRPRLPDHPPRSFRLSADAATPTLGSRGP